MVWERVQPLVIKVVPVPEWDQIRSGRDQAQSEGVIVGLEKGSESTRPPKRLAVAEKYVPNPLRGCNGIICGD